MQLPMRTRQALTSRVRAAQPAAPAPQREPEERRLLMIARAGPGEPVEGENRTASSSRPGSVDLLHILTNRACLEEIRRHLSWQDLARLKVAVKGFRCQGIEEEILWAEVDFLKGPLVVPTWTELDRGYHRARHLCAAAQDLRCATGQVFSHNIGRMAGLLGAVDLCFLGAWFRVFWSASLQQDAVFLMSSLAGILLGVGANACSLFVLAREHAHLGMQSLDASMLRDQTPSHGVEKELLEDISFLSALPRTLAAGNTFLRRWRELLLQQGQPAVLRRALRGGDDRAVVEATGAGPLKQSGWPYGSPQRLAGVLTRAIEGGRLGDARRLVRAGVPATLPDDAANTAALAVRQRLPAAVAQRDYRLTYRLLSIAPVAWPDRDLCDALVGLIGTTYNPSFLREAVPLIRQAVDDSGGRVANYALADGVRRALAGLDGSAASRLRLSNWVDAWVPERLGDPLRGQSILLQVIRERSYGDARQLVKLGIIEPGAQALELYRNLSGGDELR